MMARVVSYLFVSATVLACLGLRADAQGGYMPSVAVLVHWCTVVQACAIKLSTQCPLLTFRLLNSVS